MRRIRIAKKKSRVTFSKSAKTTPKASVSYMATANSPTRPLGDLSIEELSNNEDDGQAHSSHPKSALDRVPLRFRTLPVIGDDDPPSETSEVQDETVLACLPFLAGTEAEQASFNAAGVPQLRRKQHIRFLRLMLPNTPSAYIGFDSTRPWLLYWTFTGLSLLGEDISMYRER